MEVLVKNIISIFTIQDGEIKVLLKDNDLIKLECNDDINVVNDNYIKENLKIENLNLEQCYTFSEKQNEKLIISILFVDIVNVESINLNIGLNLISINDLNIKDKYTQKSLEYLRKKLVLNSTIKSLFPGEFSLPEIQKIYENLLEKKYDRRNFRKKLIKLDVIQPLDKVSINKNGRPAKLYSFKEVTEDKILF